MSALFSSPSQPAPRNLTTELQQTLAGYQSTAPGYLALEQQYQPLYAQLTQGINQQIQPGNIAMQSTQRAADIADVAKLGPAAVQAQLAANPMLAGSLQNLYGRTQDSSLLQALNQQAEQQLALGGNLTPQEITDATQQTRAGFSDRGMLMGNQALGAEVLNRDALSRQRLAAAQQFASSVQGQNQNQNDFVGRASQIFGTQLSDPYLAILGRSSTAGGSGGGQQIGTGATLFNPTNPYAADIYNSNFNAQSAASIAGQNQQAALEAAGITSSTSALIGGLSAAGLFASDKRVKKNVKTIGKSPFGYKIIKFSYKGEPEFIGAEAQDVEKKNPDAVVTLPSGLKMVDYNKIDVPFASVPSTLSSRLQLKEAA